MFFPPARLRLLCHAPDHPDISGTEAITTVRYNQLANCIRFLSIWPHNSLLYATAVQGLGAP